MDTPEPEDESAAKVSRVKGQMGAIQYTDVILIGNGPSGICLSFLLSGHWPYYTGAPHPDEFLQMRLQDGGDKSLIEQDLELLSNGLEGRSPNPVALLFDALTHPEADMGMDTSSLLSWEWQEDRNIPHVVLGKKAAGGAWQMMEGQMQTLSLGNWMQLPGLPFKQWLSHYRSTRGESASVARLQEQNRASMEEVREYYVDYVKQKGLESNFENHSTVSSVERVLDVCHSVDDESGEQTPCSQDHRGKFKWEVRGHRSVTDENGEESSENFCYRAPNVVMATGSYDLPNRLRAQGENLPYVLHSLQELEERIQDGGLTFTPDPLLVVVGAGLSAADAILYAQNINMPVVHVFRRDSEDPKIVYKQLPQLLYSEYHSVHQMMKDGDTDDGSYKAFPMHSVSEFREDGNVIIHSLQGEGDTIIQATLVIILIGSRPDLSFLPDSGKNLGIIPGMGIDCKNNPMAVDPYTYQSVHECGLYAMGPLVGDNFVRFLRGGSLGITSHLWKKHHGKL